MWPQIIPKFEADNSCKVEVEQVAGQQEYLQKLQTLVAAGQVGDIAHVFTGDSSFQMFFSSGMLVGLDKYISDDKFDLNQYFKFCIDVMKVDGKIGGLPFKGHPSRCGIFYNKDLFDAAGIKVPTNDSSYDDLTAAAKKLHKASASGDVDVFGWCNPGRNDLEWYIVSHSRRAAATGVTCSSKTARSRGMAEPRRTVGVALDVRHDEHAQGDVEPAGNQPSSERPVSLRASWRCFKPILDRRRRTRSSTSSSGECRSRQRGRKVGAARWHRPTWWRSRSTARLRTWVGSC